MDTLNPLIVIDKPFEDEGLESYLSRLTTLNGYKSIGWIYEKANLNVGSKILNLNTVAPPTSFHTLGILTENKEDELWKMTFYNELPINEENDLDKEITNTIKKGAFLKYNKKYCPLCLREENYFRKVWELTIYNICHKHNCYLIKQCPNCNTHINLRRPPFGKCKCGHYYMNSRTTHTNKESSKLERDISKRIYETSECHSTNRLSSLDFRNMIYLLVLFSRLSRKIYKNPTGDFTYENSLEAYNAFENWPYSFYKFIDLYKSNFKQSYDNLYVQFSEIYSICLLEFKSIHHSLSFIPEEIKNYLVNVWEDNEYILHKFRNWLDLTEAVIEIGCTYNTFRWILNNKDVSLKVIQTKDKDFILIHKDKVKELKEIIQNEITKSEAQKILNITDSALMTLITNNIIEKSKDNLRKGSTILMKSSVTGIINKFRSQASEDVTNPSIIPYKKAIAIFTGLRKPTYLIVKSVLEGRIRPVLLNEFLEEKGLKNFYFIEKEVLELARNL